MDKYITTLLEITYNIICYYKLQELYCYTIVIQLFKEY